VNEVEFVAFIVEMQSILDRINALKKTPPDGFNGRALAVAATNYETAMLWVANARML
jgi:hypothetical protein